MSLPDKETLRRKLTYLQGKMEELAPYRSLSEEEFFAKKENLPIVERYLQTAIESVLDCASLFVILRGWRRVREEEDAIRILPRHKLITEELAGRILDVKKFRNILVHEYTVIDPQRVYFHLKNDLPDLEEFARAMAGRLREEEA